MTPAANCGSSPFNLASTARARADLPGSVFQLMYFLEGAVDAGGLVPAFAIVVEAAVALVVAAAETVEAAADVIGDAFPFNFLLGGLILRGAPLFRFFNHPVMQPLSLA